MKKVITAFLAAVLLFQVGTILPNGIIQEAYANHQELVFFPGGQIFRTFDKNEAITISGAIEFVQQCPPDGLADSVFPTAFVFITPAGEGGFVNGQIIDVVGEPNVVFGSTIGGAFFEQIVGFTGPAGPIGEGVYEIIYDECQNEKLDIPDFFVSPAFEVLYTTDVAPIPPSFLTVKSQANSKVVEAAQRCFLLDAIFWLYDKVGGPPGTGNDAEDEIIGELMEVVGFISGTLTDPLPDPQQVAADVCLQDRLKWQGLAADPPDPDFKKLSPMKSQAQLGLRNNDPLLSSLTSLVNNEILQEALVSSLLQSLERYQGAEAESSGTWALIHANAIVEYSNLLSQELSENNIAIDEFLANLIADTQPFNQKAADLDLLVQEINTNGLNSEQLRGLKNLGATDVQINQVVQEFTSRDLSFTKQSIFDSLEQTKHLNLDTISSLEDFTLEFNDLILQLESDEFVTIAPRADAGGPYIADTNSNVLFDGTSSTSPSPIVSYEWDFDGDGTFDDASGPTPSFAFDSTFSGLVGLKVENKERFSDIDYSQIQIVSNNDLPLIESFQPAEFPFPEVELGSSINFQVTTTDPEDDPISIEWQVNFEPISQGNSFDYTPTNPDEVGPKIIRAVVSDDNQNARFVIQQWIVKVFDVDEDSDEWNANVDCDDSNPNVNPGMEEIPGNGLDDDCNTDTADMGFPPTAAFEVFPNPGYRNMVILFNNLSTDPDDDIVQYEWDFGDGKTSDDVNPAHLYSFTGDYTVTLTVTDEDGNTDSVEFSPVTVLDNPPVNAAPVVFDAPDSTEFGLPTSQNFVLGYGGSIISGDFNHDGFDDIVVGTTFESISFGGSAEVFFGGPDPFDNTSDLLLRDGSRGSFARSMDVGDVNGDGIDDLLIGNWWNLELDGDLEGAAFLYYGEDGTFDDVIDVTLFPSDDIIKNENSNNPAYFGSSVALADVNADGFDDIIVAAANTRTLVDPDTRTQVDNRGVVEIFYGGEGPFDTNRDLLINPRNHVPADEQYFLYGGSDNMATGDLNGDGVDDLVVGCNDCIKTIDGRSDRGFVDVFMGSEDFDDTPDTRLRGTLEIHREWFGVETAIGDINNDGFDDLIVGGPGLGDPRPFTFNSGNAHIYFGGPGATLEPNPDVILNIPGTHFFGDQLGIGDLNGDGIDDLLVGAPARFDDLPGEAFLYHGGDGFFDDYPDKTFRFLGSENYGPVAAGDVNADGLDDAVVGEFGVNFAKLTLMPPPFFETKQNQPIEIPLNGHDPDGDQLDFFVSQPPKLGKLGEIVSTGTDTATVTYTPNLGLIGHDQFSIKAHDGIEGSAHAVIHLNVLRDDQAIDENSPNISPPPNIVVNAISPDGQEIDIGNPRVADDFDPNPIVINDAPTLFPIGNTIVTWRATDESGNFAEAIQSVTVQDSSPPQVQIIAPGDGDAFNEGDAIDIQVNAIDNVKVDKVELFVDGELFDERFVAESEPPFSFPFVAPLLHPGDSSPKELILQARAVDLVGQSVTSAITLKIEDATAPPTPNLTLPPDGSLFFAENPILAWRNVEDPSIPLEYTPRLVNLLNPTEPLTLLSLNPLALATPTVLLQDGNYQWQVMATDSKGNASPFSIPFSFSVDTIPPPPTQLLSPADNSILSDNLPTLEWEDVSGADTLFYIPRLEKVDETPTVPIEIVSLSLTSSKPITVLEQGDYQWMVTVLDEAGNKAESSQFSFSVDTLVEEDATIADLIELIISLRDEGILDARAASSLLWLANAAQDAENGNDFPTAISKIKNLIQRVELFEKRNLISPEASHPITDLAQKVLESLN